MCVASSEHLIRMICLMSETADQSPFLVRILTCGDLVFSNSLPSQDNHVRFGKEAAIYAAVEAAQTSMCCVPTCNSLTEGTDGSADDVRRKN